MKKTDFFKKSDGTRKNVEPVLPQNDYYEAISEKLGIAQVVIYLSLLTFVVLSFLRNTDLITYQNFYYFVKDLNASAETVDVWNTDAVSYPANDEQSFTLYREGLAVAGNNSVTVFTATGRQTVSETIAYHNPIAVGSGKYLLVYDHGGTQYSLYNSYTQIFAGESDYPISDAAVSSTGKYALTTSSAEHTSVVSLYSDNFSLINVYRKNGYVMDIAINPKGDTISLLTSTASMGQFHTELMVCRIHATEAITTKQIADSLALSCVFTENDTVSILCSGGVYIYETDGDLINSVDLSGDTVACFDASESGLTVCLKTSGTSEKKHILAFDKQGILTYDGLVSRQVERIDRYENMIYLQTAYGVLRLNANNGALTEILCQTEQRFLLAVNKTEFLLCSPQRAVYMNFD